MAWIGILYVYYDFCRTISNTTWSTGFEVVMISQHLTINNAMSVLLLSRRGIVVVPSNAIETFHRRRWSLVGVRSYVDADHARKASDPRNFSCAGVFYVQMSVYRVPLGCR